jgi:NitT/TauT family transport system substrate-binding protein
MKTRAKQAILRRRTKGWLFIAMLAIMVGLLAACSGKSKPTTVRMAVLPILDALPMYVAQEKGYFEDENIVVEFVPVTSAAERDLVIQAGQADGMINEILSTLFYNAEQPTITIVRYARVPTPEFPQFYVLSAPDSGIMTVDDLRGQNIGISEGTIIEYSTDRLLEAEGLSADDISTIAVPRIPDRMALLSSGELPAANLPDPLATLAIQGGAHVIVDDSKYPEYGHSTISFRNDFIKGNEDAVRGFLAAIERATEDINQDKQQFSSLLTERSLVPEPLIGSFTVPDFPTASVPPPSQWNDVVNWALQKGYVAAELDYGGSVDDSYLP